MGKIDELIQQYCPYGVEYVSIGSLITRVRDKGKNNPSVKTVYSVSNTLGLVKAEDFRDNVIYSEDTSNYVVVEQGMFAYNPARLNIGSLAYLQNNQPGLVSPMYVVFGIDKTKILPEYLYLHLKSPYIIGKINSLTESGARFRFDFERWGLIEIPLPPLPVQEAIVNILDRFAVYAAELQAELQARQQQYQYYRDTLLSFDGRDDVQWKKLGEVADLGTGSHNTQDGLVEGKYPFYTRGSEILYLNDYDYDETAIITAGDGAGVGKVFHFVQGKYALHQRAYRIVPNEKIVLARFVYYYIGATFYNYIMKSSVSSSVVSIRKPMMVDYPIPVPSIEEQERVISILDNFYSLTNDLTQGLPAEIEARQQQYEYYRDQLLTFKRKEA